MTLGTMTKRRLRRELVPGTVANAVKTAFYQKLWAGIDISSVRSDLDLNTLPLIAKASHGAALDDARAEGQTPVAISHSSGTTGNPFIRFRGRQDLDALHAFVNRMNAKNHDSDSEARIAVNATSPSGHGSAVMVPENEVELYVRPKDNVGLERALALLGRTDLLGPEKAYGVELRGHYSDLLALAMAFRARELDPGQLRIRRVICLGDYVAAPTRALLRDFLECQIIDRFSASEVCGGATRCEKCELFHVDPVVVPDVVSAASVPSPSSAGAGPVALGPGQPGALVLSELAPFSTYQPFVRWVTGDLVEIQESPCEPEDLSFRYLGRIDDAIFDPEGTAVWLRPALLRDCLEADADVLRSGWGSERFTALGAMRLGPPMVSYRLSQGVLSVAVATAFPAAAHPQRGKELAQRIEQALLHDNPELSQAVQTGRYRIAVRATDESGVGPLTIRPKVI